MRKTGGREGLFGLFMQVNVAAVLVIKIVLFFLVHEREITCIRETFALLIRR